MAVSNLLRLKGVRTNSLYIVRCGVVLADGYKPLGERGIGRRYGIFRTNTGAGLQITTSNCRPPFDHRTNRLNRQFTVDAPDRVWVTDISPAYLARLVILGRGD